MKQPYVSTLIEQDFTSAEKALGRQNIDAISSADIEGYATQEWVQDQSYVTSADLPDVSDMATKTWTSENFYPDTNPSGYVTSADVSGFVDMNYVENNFYSVSNPSGFITSADIPQFQQVQSDWTEYDNTDPSYIQNKPVPAALEAISPLYIIDESSASRIGIESSALPSMTGIGLKAGYGIQFVDETSAVKINSNVPYPTVECHPISAEYSGAVLVIYPQSSACCEMHVTTPHRYDVASYSAKINDDVVYSISSGSWYEFVKQDWEGTQEWCFKDSGTYYA